MTEPLRGKLKAFLLIGTMFALMAAIACQGERGPAGAPGAPGLPGPWPRVAYRGGRCSGTARERRARLQQNESPAIRRSPRPLSVVVTYHGEPQEK